MAMASVESLFEDVVRVQRLLEKKNVQDLININKIFEKLEAHGLEMERVTVVLKEIQEEYGITLEDEHNHRDKNSEVNGIEMQSGGSSAVCLKRVKNNVADSEGNDAESNISVKSATGEPRNSEAHDVSVTRYAPPVIDLTSPNLSPLCRNDLNNNDPNNNTETAPSIVQQEHMSCTKNFHSHSSDIEDVSITDIENDSKFGSSTNHWEDQIMQLQETLMQDASRILAIIPSRTYEEIYAYLEAHHDNPNRVQIVVEEFLGMEPGLEMHKQPLLSSLGATIPKQQPQLLLKEADKDSQLASLNSYEHPTSVKSPEAPGQPVLTKLGGKPLECPVTHKAEADSHTQLPVYGRQLENSVQPLKNTAKNTPISHCFENLPVSELPELASKNSSSKKHFKWGKRMVKGATFLCENNQNNQERSIYDEHETKYKNSEASGDNNLDYDGRNIDSEERDKSKKEDDNEKKCRKRSDDEQKMVETDLELHVNNNHVMPSKRTKLHAEESHVIGDTANALSVVLREISESEKVSKEQYETLQEMFPDAEVDFLWRECQLCGGDEWKFQNLIDRLLNESDDPTVEVIENTCTPASDDPPAEVLGAAVPSTTDNYQVEVDEMDASLTSEDNVDNIEDLITQNLELLISIFPNADPEFLHQKCKEFHGEEDSLKNFVSLCIEKNDYPTREQYLKRKEKEDLQQKFTGNINPEEFLEDFPEPFKYFFDETRPVSVLYRKHASAQLKLECPHVLACDIDIILKQHNYHYTPALRHIENVTGRRRQAARKSWECGFPQEDDIKFLQEVAFAKNEEKIKNYQKQMEEQRHLALEEAKKQGAVFECGCCFDNECLLEDMMTCEEGDMFCKACVRRGSEVQIGNSKTVFPCFRSGCEAQFSLDTLQKALNSSVFSKLLQRKQLEEVEAAGIDDLEKCPFCNFATIMPNKEDKIFKCLNSECMKESCRQCKQLSHVPLRCEEVENDSEVHVRTYIENKMTEAMIRKCWKCKKKYFKEDGCNKICCPCGAMMCYLCHQPVKGYNHFYHDSAEEGKCPLWSNNHQLHLDEVKKGATAAKQTVKEQNPAVQLKHDPSKILPEAKKHKVKNDNMYAIPLQIQCAPHMVPFHNLQILRGRWDQYHLNAQACFAQMLLNNIRQQDRHQARTQNIPQCNRVEAPHALGFPAGPQNRHQAARMEGRHQARTQNVPRHNHANAPHAVDIPAGPQYRNQAARMEDRHQAQTQNMPQSNHANAPRALDIPTGPQNGYQAARMQDAPPQNWAYQQMRLQSAGVTGAWWQQGNPVHDRGNQQQGNNSAVQWTQYRDSHSKNWK